MDEHPVVPAEDWISARKALLAKEKEFMRLRDELARRRRDLPWEAVTKEYFFGGPDGTRSLPQLFDGRRQLIVYHFMYPPEWDDGCPRGGVPYLLGVRPGHRHAERRLPLPRPGPEGPRRGRPRQPPVLGAPPRRIRELTGPR